ncbi:MAG: carbon-nitrogen hydrolase family protein [Pseudomonadota bacterium]
MTQPFRLALWQGPSPSGNIDLAFETIEKVLSAAAAMGADLALFPEVYLPGYNAPQMTAQPLEGDWMQRLGALASRHDIAITIGIAERDGAEMRNTAVAIGPDGKHIATYRKVQLWEDRENALYERGTEYVVFPYRGRTIGMQICYDIEFPEHTRALMRMGADLILCPTANPKPYDNVNRFAVAARAMENAVTVAYCNFCGPEGELEYVGNSVIAGPEGDPLASAGNAPALLVTNIPVAGAPMERPTEHLKDLRTL